jgi:hypothetical protein
VQFSHDLSDRQTHTHTTMLAGQGHI